MAAPASVPGNLKWYPQVRRLALELPGGTHEFFDHAADVGIRCRATSVDELFLTAARAMLEWAGPAPEGRESVSLRVSLEAEDLEALLVRWLQEILYLFDHRRLYFVAANSLRVADTALQGELLARPWDPSSCSEYQEIKAITYHQLRVCEEGGSWHASVILDI
jgi:SHS2 domain-containing protein